MLSIMIFINIIMLSTVVKWRHIAEHFAFKLRVVLILRISVDMLIVIILSDAMLSAVMLPVVMLTVVTVVMLSAVMLSAVMPSAVTLSVILYVVMPSVLC
jgi:hypothetical protein